MSFQKKLIIYYLLNKGETSALKTKNRSLSMQIRKKQTLPSKEETPFSKIDEEYEKWLDEFVGNPTITDLNKMKKVIDLSLPQNNPNYFPIQGA